MDHKTTEAYILSLPGSWLDYPFGEGVAVYKVGGKEDGKMFALIQEGVHPVRVSLKSDPLLSKALRDKYESVMQGYHLNKKHCITVVQRGQLSDDEVKDLIRHSYELVTNT